jgi:hypothetical protein
MSDAGRAVPAPATRSVAWGCYPETPAVIAARSGAWVRCAIFRNRAVFAPGARGPGVKTPPSGSAPAAPGLRIHARLPMQVHGLPARSFPDHRLPGPVPGVLAPCPPAPPCPGATGAARARSAQRVWGRCGNAELGAGMRLKWLACRLCPGRVSRSDVYHFLGMRAYHYFGAATLAPSVPGSAQGWRRGRRGAGSARAGRCSAPGIPRYGIAQRSEDPP